MTLAAAGQDRPELPAWGIAIFLVIFALVGVFVFLRRSRKRP
ncbi:MULTISPECIES: hypothetical protein [unclassified Streptomyces]